MAEMTGKRNRGISLVVGGLFFFLMGIFTGYLFMPRAVISSVMLKTCIDSKQHSGYEDWVGSLKMFNKDKLMKIHYWNITNKEGFLYKGEMPVVKEVGPYVYRLSLQNVDVTYNDVNSTVKYKKLQATQYDAASTKAECPTCTEADKITLMNAGYIAVMLNAKGDKNFAFKFIPFAIQSLFVAANQSGYSKMQVLQQFGNFSGTLFPPATPMFPTGWYPAEFAAWLSLQNRTSSSPLHDVLSTMNRTKFTIPEMNALIGVMTNSTILGTSINNATASRCLTDSKIAGCGFLFYLNAFDKLSKMGANTTGIMTRIQNSFCTSPPASCMILDSGSFRAVSLYITNHIPKLAIFLAVDRIDFGPVMTRTVKQVSHGFIESGLKIPPDFPNGLPVEGFLPVNKLEDASSKSYSKFYTCKDSSKAFQYKEYDDSRYVRAEYYPEASLDDRLVEGYSAIVTPRNSVKICTGNQPAPKTSYTIFDSALQLKVKISKRGDQKGKLFTHKFALESQDLFKTNNISVFKDGLLDISRIKKGIPLVVSMPHFLHSDPSLKKLFNMKPKEMMHNSFFNIEPVTGIPFKTMKRSQLNIALPEVTIAAPRQPAFNISYKESIGAKHYSTVVPVFWIEIKVNVPKLAESFSELYSFLDGACAVVIIVPLIGGFCIVLGIIFFVRAYKIQVSTLTDSYQ